MWAKVYLLFCCSIKAKSSFTHILSEPQSLQMLIDQRIFENFRLKQNTCPHNHSYYQRKQYLPEKNKTTAYPLAVNVPYHFLLCLPTFTAEAHTVRKSYCTSFAHAPRLISLLWDPFHPMWRVEDKSELQCYFDCHYNSSKMIGLLLGCLKWRCSGHELFILFMLFRERNNIERQHAILGWQN